MENIIKLFEAVGIIILIGFGIAVLIYPIQFEINFRTNYGKKGISYGWVICQIIAMVGLFSYGNDPSSDGFYEALGFTIIVFVIAIMSTYKRMKKMQYDKVLCLAAAFAQLMAPVGILFIILLLSSIFNKNDKDGDKKNPM